MWLTVIGEPFFLCFFLVFQEKLFNFANAKFIYTTMTQLSKIGRYGFSAEPFHCDFSGREFWGHMANHMLNAADYHSTERGFGISMLMQQHKTWVLSRLVIEMEQMPQQHQDFSIETWVESAMRFFTNRNFRVESTDGSVLGYGRSIWAMIDTESRQPVNIFDINNGEICNWVEEEKENPISRPSRVKLSKDIPLAEERTVRYSDVDINGHFNSAKYIEHALDLFPLTYYQEHTLRHLDVAYVAEAYAGQTLHYYKEQEADNIYNVRITKLADEGEVECCRIQLVFN